MKPKKMADEIIEHWYTLVPSQQFSSKEFYDQIEEGIKAQKVPALALSRVDLAEGGLLSDRREYLRMKRERLTFDVCAAPVGVNYFFSYRFYAEPAVVRPWELIAFFVGLSLLVAGSVRFVGIFLGPFLLAVAVVFLAWLMRNAIGLGLRDLDASLIKAPVIGPIYERFFRKDTYYRQDMRIAYCSIVSGLVKQEVERITAAKGVQLIREFTYSPIMHDLYRAKEVVPGPEEVAEPIGA
jgi:hypothetical protein